MSCWQQNTRAVRLRQAGAFHRRWAQSALLEVGVWARSVPRASGGSRRELAVLGLKQKGSFFFLYLRLTSTGPILLLDSI